MDDLRSQVNPEDRCGKGVCDYILWHWFALTDGWPPGRRADFLLGGEVVRGRTT